MSSLIYTPRLLNTSDPPIWELKLRELWFDTKVSIKSLARHLGVDHNTAKRHAALLNFPPRRGSSNTPSEKTPPASNKKDKFWYRTQWLALLGEAKDEPLYVLRGRAKGIYSWLVRHDKDWFTAHRPIPRKRQKTSASLARVNQRNQIYMRHDAHVAEAIQAAAYKLINIPGRPIKVSRNKITLEVPEVRRLRVGVNNMPLATQALKEVVETSEGLVLRRIKWTLERYIEEQSCPSQRKFLDRAGLNARILQVQNVQKAFDSAISTLSQFT